MAIRPVRITPESEQELALLSEQPPARMAEAYAHLEKPKSALVSLKALRGTFEPVLESETARVLAKQLISLGVLMRRSRRTPADVVEGLTLGLKARKWDGDKLARWEAIAPTMSLLLGHDQIVIAAKSLDLSYDFEHIFQSSKILTDIRPVFNKNRNKIVGAIVCHRLRLYFTDEETIRSLSIAMDKADLIELRDACVEALAKAELSGELATKTCGLSVVVVGEDLNELS